MVFARPISSSTKHQGQANFKASKKVFLMILDQEKYIQIIPQNQQNILIIISKVSCSLFKNQEIGRELPPNHTHSQLESSIAKSCLKQDSPELCWIKSLFERVVVHEPQSNSLCLVGNNTSSIGVFAKLLKVYKSVESESDSCEAKPVFYSDI